MANPHKGEVEFESSGQTYKLRFSADAISNLEDTLDMNVAAIGEIMGDPKKLRFGIVRTMFVAALKDQHDDLDDAKITKVFKSLSPPKAIELVVEAFNRAFDVAEGDGGANPQQPVKTASGTSPAS